MNEDKLVAYEWKGVDKPIFNIDFSTGQIKPLSFGSGRA